MYTGSNAQFLLYHCFYCNSASGAGDCEFSDCNHLLHRIFKSPVGVNFNKRLIQEAGFVTEKYMSLLKQNLTRENVKYSPTIHPMFNSPMTVTYENSLVSPAMFVATQAYIPTSSGVISIIFKFPAASSIRRVSLASTGRPLKSQAVDGSGTPSTGHLSRRSLPSMMETFPPMVCSTILRSSVETWFVRDVMMRGTVAVSIARSARENTKLTKAVNVYSHSSFQCCLSLFTSKGADFKTEEKSPTTLFKILVNTQTALQSYKALQSLAKYLSFNGGT